MLELLGEELLSGVLQHLGPTDLRAARRASKLLDAASRTQLEAAATLQLTLRNTTDKFPTFVRFPRLRCIVFANWDPSEANVDRSSGKSITNAFMDTPHYHLAGVTEVSAQHSSHTLSLALPLLLNARLRNVTRLHVGDKGARPIDLNMLAAILLGAPKLEHFCVHVDYYTDHVVDILTTGALRLKSLTVSYEHDALISGKGMRMIAGRMGQLTSLVFESAFGHACVPFDADVDGLRLQQCCVLRGVSLPFGCVEMLAAGLPQLRVLEVAAVGSWGVTSAVFRSVSYLKLTGASPAGFCSAFALSSVFPSLQHLVAQFTESDSYDTQLGVPDYHVPLAGLTGLRSLKLRNDEWYWSLGPEQWDAIATMPHLQQLACDMKPSDVAQLRRLASRGLHALDVCFWEHDPEEYDVFDAGDALVEIGCQFPRLRALHVAVAERIADMSHSSLCRFVHSVPLLEMLIVDCVETNFGHACDLAMHSNLRMLVRPRTDEADDKWEQLAIEHGERGLAIKFVKDGCPDVFNGAPPVQME